MITLAKNEMKKKKPESRKRQSQSGEASIQETDSAQQRGHIVLGDHTTLSPPEGKGD